MQVFPFLLWSPSESVGQPRTPGAPGLQRAEDVTQDHLNKAPNLHAMRGSRSSKGYPVHIPGHKVKTEQGLCLLICPGPSDWQRKKKKITQRKINVQFLLCKQDWDQVGCTKQFFTCKAKNSSLRRQEPLCPSLHPPSHFQQPGLSANECPIQSPCDLHHRRQWAHPTPTPSKMFSDQDKRYRT